ncbi:MAG: ATP-binding protein [Pseudomonadota bacterium]
MKDEGKTREKLLDEIAELKSRLKELEASKARQKSIEETLRLREERFRTTVDFTYDWETWQGPDGRYLYVSPSCERITGYRQDEFLKDPTLFEKIIHPEDQKATLDHLQETFDHKGVLHLDFRIISRDGNERWISHYCQGVYSDDGTWLGRRASNRDITKRKNAEEALQKSSEKIKMFAYSVSHDLKNPAIAIHGLAKLLHKNCRHLLDEKGRQYCDQIIRASEHIAALVEKINVYISTKEAPLTLERVPLKEITEVVKEEFYPELHIRRIKWMEPDLLPEVKADRLSILRVFRNLVDNALKYGGEDLKEIEVGYTDSDEFHILSVKDDGIGIQDQDSEKIFVPFKRKKSSGKREGAGLGLAIVKEIAEQHGGAAWLESGSRKGATFYISISKSL